MRSLKSVFFLSSEIAEVVLVRSALFASYIAIAAASLPGII